MAINLLTPNMSARSGGFRVGALLKNILIIVIVVFITFLIVSGALILINTIQLSVSRDRQEKLRQEVLNLERTEQRLALVKDRLGKAKGILDSDNVYEKIDFLSPVLSIQDVEVLEIDVDESHIEILISAPSSDAVRIFTERLVAGDLFRSIRISEFSYNSNSGYFVAYEML